MKSLIVASYIGAAGIGFNPGVTPAPHQVTLQAEQPVSKKPISNKVPRGEMRLVYNANSRFERRKPSNRRERRLAQKGKVY